MKRFTLAVIITVLTAACAFGAVKDFGKFTLDIPEGWTAELADDTEEGYYTVNIENSGKTSSMSFTYAPTSGYSLDDLLEDWTNMEESASKPERTNDGYYMYTYKNENGKKTSCYVRSEANGMYIAADMSGDDVKAMTAIRDSFAVKSAPKK